MMKKILLLAAICGAVFAEQTYELNVPNMNCGGCAKKIEDAARGVKGVTGVSFDLKSKDVNITADSGVNVMDIVHAIQAKKYKVGIKE